MKIIRTAEFPPSDFSGEEVLPVSQRSRTSYTTKELDRLTERSKKLDEVRQTLEELREYLTLPKFHKDTTVQVQDVLNRLPHIYPD